MRNDIIGFYNLLEYLDATSKVAKTPCSYPPYNLKKVKEDDIMLEVALAGFTKDDIEVKKDQYNLTIQASKKDEKKDEDNEYYYKGISSRKATLAFKLEPYYEVNDVKYVDGILYVNIKYEIPEEKKPKIFKIE